MPTNISTADETTDRATNDRTTIREYEQWLVWRYSQGGTKKPPFDPETGGAASVNDPETWSDHGTARKYADSHSDIAGIGFVLTEDDPFVGWDLDDVIDDDGVVSPWAAATIVRLDSYTEFSPSKTGFHTLTAGSKPGSRTSRKQGNGTKVEVFESGHYVTVTGDHFAGTPTTVKDCQTAIDAVYDDLVGHDDGDPSSTTNAAQADLKDLDTDVLDESLVDRMCAGIRDFFESLPHDATSASDELNDLLEGIYREQGHIAKDGSADRSEAELVLATLLVGIARKHTDIEPENVPKAVAHLLTDRCRKEKKTDDGQTRKWVAANDAYRKQLIATAIEEFDPKVWKAWSLTTNGNDYSYLTYDAVLFAVDEAPDHTKETIRNLARISDDFANAAKTYGDALTDLVNDYGQVKRAKIEGSNRHVYLLTHEPDPPDAEYVVEGGEQRDPTDLNPPKSVEL